MTAVVPIGVIVAVAIVCVVAAVLNAAHRADDVALETERQLFARALTGKGRRLLREIESVIVTEYAKRRILADFDSEWARTSVSARLQSTYDHDFVFIADPADHIIYSSPDRRSLDQAWPLSVHSEMEVSSTACAAAPGPRRRAPDPIATRIAARSTPEPSSCSRFWGRQRSSPPSLFSIMVGCSPPPPGECRLL
jgi:hypothetical protein